MTSISQSSRTDVRSASTIRRIAVFALTCAILAICAQPSSAAVGVSPLSGVVAPGTTAIAFTISNPDNAERVVQPEVSRWEHVDGKDRLTKSNDWVVNPPVATVPALGSRVIRMALKRRVSLTDEVMYRLVLSEVNNRAESTGVNMAVTTHVSLPVFVEPATISRKKPEWSAARDGDRRIVVTLKNTAPLHVHVTQFVLRTAGGKALETSAPSYVFAGETRTYTLVLDSSAPDIGNLIVEAHTDTGMTTLPITGR